MLSTAAVVLVTVGCSDRVERQLDAPANQTGAAIERGADAVGEAAQDTGNAVADAARGTGDAVLEGSKAAAAAVETADVKLALTADRRVDAGDINVDADHVTKTVMLKGRVPTEAQKALAEEIAKGKATGYVVRNMLVVGR